jgi:hypothetical protein
VRLVLQGRRRGAGQRGLTRGRAALLAVLGAALVAALVVLGGEPERPPPPAAPPPPAPPAARPPLVLGLAEQNPHLVGLDVPAAFAPWRDRAVALRPRLFRLLVPWSAVQPRRSAPPDWAAPQSGCARGAAPCAPFAGIRDLLRAVRARQRADGGWEVVVSVFAAPGWALARRGGCPPGGAVDLPAYAALLRSLAALGRAEGVRLPWWSPWNEPNHPAFLAPQRAACGRGERAVSPAAYGALVRAARAALPPGAQLVLGEVAGYDGPRPDRLGAAELAAALPRDVACAAPVWAQHTYVGRGRGELAADRDAAGNRALTDAVVRALAAHGCPRAHRVWITETGAAAGPRACAGMRAALAAWARDPRVDAAVQYSFRDDPAFPVGLADAGLRRLHPSYRAWLGRPC